MMPSVLIVDDEPDLRDILTSSFERNGFRVLQAANGTEAWQMLNKIPVDVVLTDLRMPGGSGIDLLDRIRAADFEHPAVLLVSGFSEHKADELLARGADAIFPKPFKRAEIIAVAQRFLLPRLQRWSHEPAEANEATLTSTVHNLDQLIVGRGGVQIPVPTGDLNINQRVRIHLGEETLVGLIRCLVHEDSGEELCGVEILWATPALRQRINEQITRERPKAFIPAAPSLD